MSFLTGGLGPTYTSAVIDSFEDGDLEEYEGQMDRFAIVSGPSSTAGSAVDGENVLLVEATGGSHDAIHSHGGLAAYPTRGSTFSFWASPGDVTADKCRVAMYFAGDTDVERYYHAYVRFEDDSFQIRRFDGEGNIPEVDQESFSAATGEWYEFEIDFDTADDGTIAMTAKDDDGNELNTASITSTHYDTGSIGWAGENTGSTALIDHAHIKTAGEPGEGAPDPTTTVVDDFEDGDLSEYDEGSPGAYSVTSSGPVYDGSSALECPAGTTAWIASTSGLDAYPSRGDDYTVYFYLTDTADGLCQLRYGYQDHDHFYYMFPRVENGRWAIRRATAGGHTPLDAVHYSYVSDEWYRAELEWGSGGAMTAKLYLDGDDELVAQAGPVTDNYYADGGVGVLTSGASAEWYVDSMVVVD